MGTSKPRVMFHQSLLYVSKSSLLSFRGRSLITPPKLPILGLMASIVMTQPRRFAICVPHCTQGIISTDSSSGKGKIIYQKQQHMTAGSNNWPPKKIQKFYEHLNIFGGWKVCHKFWFSKLLDFFPYATPCGAWGGLQTVQEAPKKQPPGPKWQ